MKRLILLLFLIQMISCNNPRKQTEQKEAEVVNAPKAMSEVALKVLGTAQDGGSPHIGCKKSCCEKLWNTPDATRKVVSLGLIDYKHDKRFIIEASPDFTEQLSLLNRSAGKDNDLMPDGILLTHAHIGHYTGLMYLGREAKGAKNVPVFTMPIMKKFLSTNGPWDQLVKLKNIELQDLENENKRSLTPNIRVEPILVPHRDEYSETVGYIIYGPQKSALFIPDIDKWEKWDKDIKEWVTRVDYAFVDATFYDAKEINNRDVSEIPHPFVIESMQLFGDLSKEEKAKIHFIHLNHTNPLWEEESEEYRRVVSEGFQVGSYGETVYL